MYCPNCGQQIPDNSFFCPACGSDMNSPVAAPMQEAAEVKANGFAHKLRNHLKSPLFLVICILLTCAVLFSFSFSSTVSMDASGEAAYSSSFNTNFDIFSILVLIGMWMLYVKARSRESVIPDKGFKLVSGVLTAIWIINWICAVIMALCGIAFVVIGPMVAPYASEIEAAFASPEVASVLELYASLGIDMEMMNNILSFIQQNVVLVITGIGIAFIVIAVVMVLLNIFYYGNLRRFANNITKSYYANEEKDLRYGTVSVWLLVSGIFNAIVAVNTLINTSLMGISPVCHAAVMILAYVWIKKLGEADVEEITAE